MKCSCEYVVGTDEEMSLMWVCDSFCGRMIDATEVEDRIAELEDLQRRMAKASKLEDLQRINDLEQWREEDADTIANFARAEVEKDDRIRELERELAEAKKDMARLDWLERGECIVEYVQHGWVVAHSRPEELISAPGYGTDPSLRAAIDKARGK